MSEEENKQIPKEEEQEGADAPKDAGDKPKATNLIDGANAAAERLEKATKEARVENDRKEEIAAKQMLGGTTEAGQQPVKKEETPKEYNDRIEKEISEGKHDE